MRQTMEETLPIETETDATPGSAKFFGAQADRWHTLYERKACFVDRLNLFTGTVQRLFPTGGTVLDVGCGAGNIALELAELGYRVVGVDGAPQMIEQAKAECSRRGIQNAEFRIADLSESVFDAGRFDAVVCSSVIEYIEDDASFLARISDALRPGGFLLLSVPNASSLLGRLEDVVAKIPGFTGPVNHAHLNFSLRRYGSKTLRASLARTGLEWSSSVLFEVPIPGRLGVMVSRLPAIGVLRLVIAEKSAPSLQPSEAARRKNRPRARTRAWSRKNLWEATPASVKAVVGIATGRLPTAWLLGRSFRRTLAFVQEAQTWSSERTRTYQLDQLRRICTLAYDKTKFYRERFDSVGFHPKDIKSLDDMRRLPTIDRNTLRGHMDDMCTVSPDGIGIDIVSTGGSSGEPLRFYIGTNRSAFEYAYLVASWSRIGYELSVPQAVLRSEVVPRNRKGLRHCYDPILRRHYYSNFHMDDENMRRYVEHVATLGPCFLHVYPSSVSALARFIERSNMTPPPNVLGVIAESEIVYSDQRETVEKVFGCRYFSCYGHSERLVLASACEQSDDYHVWPTYGYFELLDENDQLITTPGQRGEIVGTGFINTVMPFIRYRTGDYATYVASRCEACGRNHTILRDIRGHRTQEMLVAADNSLIAWTALNMHDDTFANVRQFQFYQDSPGRAVLKIVPADGFSKQDEQRIIRSLARKHDGRLDIDTALVDSIRLSSIGKAIYVDQRLEVKG